MALTTAGCQQFPAARRHARQQLAVAALLSLGYCGCWQEVRYEPNKSAPSKQSSSTGSSSTGSSSTGSPLAESPLTESLPAETLTETLAGAPTGTPVGTRLAAWEISSQWSMAAALQAKGRDLTSYGDRLQQARSAAKLLGVALPDLPTHAESADPIAENLFFLLETAGPRLASALSDQHGTDHAALAELATKTHVLLLSYRPSSTRLEPVIASIRQAAQQSKLPLSVWRELVDLLAARAEFKQVKVAIFQLHQRAAAHLRSAAN